MLVAAPASVIVSAVGIFRDDARGLALAGLIVGAVTTYLFLIGPMLV
jgi:hypothetical protein